MLTPKAPVLAPTWRVNVKQYQQVALNIFTFKYIYTLSFLFTVDGTILPSNNHKAIPLEDVQFLAELMNGESKMSFVNAIFILRRKNFPFSHDPHPWIEGN
jgi:hypothetical protein